MPETNATESYEKPRYEVISLDCEISAYAPDGTPDGAPAEDGSIPLF